MENIVRLSTTDTDYLLDALTVAAVTRKSVRICTGRDNRGPWLKYDIGNTGWTPPIYGEEY